MFHYLHKSSVKVTLTAKETYDEISLFVVILFVVHTMNSMIYYASFLQSYISSFLLEIHLSTLTMMNNDFVNIKRLHLNANV